LLAGLAPYSCRDNHVGALSRFRDVRCDICFWHVADTLIASAFVRYWHKADMTLGAINVRFRGVKRTWRLHCEMSAYDADIGLDRHPVRVTNTAADPNLSAGGNATGKATDIWRNAP